MQEYADRQKQWRIEQNRKDKRNDGQRKMAYLDEIKQSLGCADCGIHDIRVLEMHHRSDEEKIKTVAAMRAYPWPKFKAEIAKCDVLCANCHKIRHYKERVK